VDLKEQKIRSTDRARIDGREIRQPAAPVRSRRTGPGGETAFHEYVFGAPKPGDGPVRALGGFGGNWLSLKATVRTNDPNA
jgi:hypothetical protein